MSPLLFENDNQNSSNQGTPAAQLGPHSQIDTSNGWSLDEPSVSLQPPVQPVQPVHTTTRNSPQWSSIPNLCPCPSTPPSPIHASTSFERSQGYAEGFVSVCNGRRPRCTVYKRLTDTYHECDVCNHKNLLGMARCADCRWQTCRPCVLATGPRHGPVIVGRINCNQSLAAGDASDISNNQQNRKNSHDGNNNDDNSSFMSIESDQLHEWSDNETTTPSVLEAAQTFMRLRDQAQREQDEETWSMSSEANPRLAGRERPLAREMEMDVVTRNSRPCPRTFDDTSLRILAHFTSVVRENETPETMRQNVPPSIIYTHVLARDIAGSGAPRSAPTAYTSSPFNSDDLQMLDVSTIHSNSPPINDNNDPVQHSSCARADLDRVGRWLGTQHNPNAPGYSRN